MVGDKPAVRVGELWTVGRHRLLVGDCRRKGDVERALGELTCELVVTDPPYCAAGVDDESRGRGTWGEIANDNLSARGYAALMDAWLERAAPRATYAFTDWRMWNALLDAHERAGLAAVAQLVWDKASAGLGAVWRTQHELVLHAARGRRSKVMGSPDRTSVLEFARTGNQYHWTEKPVELIVAILREDQLNGRSGAVVDFFAGSCTTLLAAERLGRPGVGVELVPLVAQVGLRRLELETGARAILEGDGRTLDQVADERSGS
jgi:DNA modification methylase